MPPACRLRSITSICEWMLHDECCVRQRKASSRSRWMWGTAIRAISRNSSEEKQASRRAIIVASAERPDLNRRKRREQRVLFSLLCCLCFVLLTVFHRFTPGRLIRLERPHHSILSRRSIRPINGCCRSRVSPRRRRKIVTRWRRSLLQSSGKIQLRTKLARFSIFEPILF